MRYIYRVMKSVFQVKNLYKRLGPKGKMDILAAAVRINALSSIFSADHGWIGASFSSADILTYLYLSYMRFDYSSSRPNGDILILSKGHAAPAQYASLAEAGILSYDYLLEYKQPDGPQAHTDIMTPGIPTNTGSLGQALSKAAGIALADRLKNQKRKIFVIIGDGELQEGQNYEAMMSIVKYKLTEVIPVIDRNRLQTDSSTESIIGSFNIPEVLASFGFKTRIFNGHDFKDIRRTFSSISAERPQALIADTIKGFGSSYTSMSQDTPPGEALWHSRVPNDTEYIGILEELVNAINLKDISDSFKKFKNSFTNTERKKSVTEESTRDSFAEYIIEKAASETRLVMLDADLAKSLKINTFEKKFPERFVETGISEQDMVSIAGGLALEGFISVVNTYASFFRRGFEQIYINATEKTFIIYAGSYSGLCYSTDGKSHQMTGDIPIMKSIPGMRVFDPFTPEELRGYLEYLFSFKNFPDYPVYLKLRRTPPDVGITLPDDYSFDPENGVHLCRGRDIALVAAGPHMAGYALEAARISGTDCGVTAISAQNYLNSDKISSLYRNYSTLITLEEGVTAGGLGDTLSEMLHGKKIIRRGVDDFTFSAREKKELYRKFGLDTKSISSLILNYSESPAQP